MRQTLAAGHQVVALARDPGRVEMPDDGPGRRLSVVRGDVLDEDSIAAAMTGCDAVVSAIGVRSPGRTTLYSDGMRAIVHAMQRTGVRRLLAITASPLSDGRDDTRLSRRLFMPFARLAFGSLYADMAVMEDEMRRSGLDWTIVRPPRLTNGKPRGRYRMARGGRVRGGLTISRTDLAAAMLHLLDDPTASGVAVDVAY
jgi:putative NADH-flavin reductase